MQYVRTSDPLTQEQAIAAFKSAVSVPYLSQFHVEKSTIESDVLSTDTKKAHVLSTDTRGNTTNDLRPPVQLGEFSGAFTSLLDVVQKHGELYRTSITLLTPEELLQRLNFNLELLEDLTLPITLRVDSNPLYTFAVCNLGIRRDAFEGRGRTNSRGYRDALRSLGTFYRELDTNLRAGVKFDLHEPRF